MYIEYKMNFSIFIDIFSDGKYRGKAFKAVLSLLNRKIE